MDKSTIVLGKRLVSRTETIQDYVSLIQHKNAVMGISPFFGIWAFLLKKIRFRKRFIYYCIDYYDPKIADNLWDLFFIKASHHLDRFLCNKADEIWDISGRIAPARKEFTSFPSRPSIVVPLGYPPTYFRNISKNRREYLIYVGLNPYGVELIREILPELPELKFIGLYKQPLLSTEKLLDIISYCGVGVAIWKGKGNEYYGDPGKTKLYLVCGIPVIVSKQTIFSQVITTHKAGVAIDYDKEQLKSAIKEIMENYDIYKHNAIQVGKDYCDSRKIFRDLRVLEE